MKRKKCKDCKWAKEMWKELNNSENHIICTNEDAIHSSLLWFCDEYEEKE